MNYDEMIFQLRDLKHDKEKYVDKDDPDDIIKKDVDALEMALNYLSLDNINQLIEDKQKEKEYSDKIIQLQEEQIKLYKEYVKALEDLYNG